MPTPRRQSIRQAGSRKNSASGLPSNGRPLGAARAEHCCRDAGVPRARQLTRGGRQHRHLPTSRSAARVCARSNTTPQRWGHADRIHSVHISTTKSGELKGSLITFQVSVLKTKEVENVGILQTSGWLISLLLRKAVSSCSTTSFGCLASAMRSNSIESIHR